MSLCICGCLTRLVSLLGLLLFLKVIGMNDPEKRFLWFLVFEWTWRSWRSWRDFDRGIIPICTQGIRETWCVGTVWVEIAVGHLDLVHDFMNARLFRDIIKFLDGLPGFATHFPVPWINHVTDQCRSNDECSGPFQCCQCLSSMDNILHREITRARSCSFLRIGSEPGENALGCREVSHAINFRFAIIA